MPKLAPAIAVDLAQSVQSVPISPPSGCEAVSANPEAEPEQRSRRSSGDSLLSKEVPPYVLKSGSLINDRWALRLPLLYGLEKGLDGVFASALKDAVHGYGIGPQEARARLLENMVEILESLNRTPVQQLDESAVRLRDALGKQLAHV